MPAYDATEPSAAPAFSPEEAPTSILHPSVGAGGEGGAKGLLVSLLTLMDVNRNNVLTHGGEYASTAQPLGFDVSTEAWVELVDRFGDQNRDKSDWRRDPLLDSIDLSLLSGYMSTKIDPLIEELLRRLLRGVMNTFRYNQQLEKRLQVVEQHLDHFVLEAEREKQRKMNLPLHRWKHKWVAFAFDGWKVRRTRPARPARLARAVAYARRRRYRRYWASLLGVRRRPVGRLVLRARTQECAPALPRNALQPMVESGRRARDELLALDVVLGDEGETSQREIEARSAHEQLDAFASRFAELSASECL
jgi:hypothetical protein